MSDAGRDHLDDRLAGDAVFAPDVAEPAVGGSDTEALLLGVMRDVRDLLSHLLTRLEQLDRTVAARPSGGPGDAAVVRSAIEPVDAKVREIGGALGSIATMLESIESAVHDLPSSSVPIPGPSAALLERVAAAGGVVGTDALLHARVEAIEQHAEATWAEVTRIKAQLDFIEEGIGYLAAGLLGGG